MEDVNSCYLTISQSEHCAQADYIPRMSLPHLAFVNGLLKPLGASLVPQTVKKSARNADLGLIPGSGRCPGEGDGNLLQYSCLENSMDRGAW